MLSEICIISDIEVLTKFNFDDNNIFCKNGFLTEPGIIENIAQSAAAMNGFNAVKNNHKVKRGFIGSVNNLEIFRFPKSGIAIETKVKVENQVMNVNIIKGIIRQNGILIAECEMKIFLEE
jgi:hypothetical protein